MITLAQISDVHLAPLPAVRLAELSVKRALGLANWHRKRKRLHRRDLLDALVADLRAQQPDHVAVTGDLVNIGTPAEIAEARLWLESLGPPALVTAIPGNHDVYSHRHGPEGIEQWRAWMADLGAPVAAVHGGWHGFPFVKRLGRVALIGTSSAVHTPPFMASGRLGPRQLAELDGLLAALGAEGTCRVVLIHHPPLPGQASRTRGLDDAQELAALIARRGAELVLHGHNHVPMLAYAPGPAGPVPVVGAPSASAVPHGRQATARYNLLRIAAEGAGYAIDLIGRQASEATGGLQEVERRRLSPPPA